MSEVSKAFSEAMENDNPGATEVIRKREALMKVLEDYVEELERYHFDWGYHTKEKELGIIKG